MHPCVRSLVAGTDSFLYHPFDTFLTEAILQFCQSATEQMTKIPSSVKGTTNNKMPPLSPACVKSLLVVDIRGMEGDHGPKSAAQQSTIWEITEICWEERPTNPSKLDEANEFAPQ